MEEKDLLKKIEQWAKESHAYLSSRTPYAKGYKDGITQAKEIILNIIETKWKS